MTSRVRSSLVRILPALLVTITLLSSPSLVAISGPQASVTPQTARSTTIATGTLSVLWGDPYEAARVDQGTGNVTMTIQGNITPRADLPGYYTYTYPSNIDGDVDERKQMAGRRLEERLLQPRSSLRHARARQSPHAARAGRDGSARAGAQVHPRAPGGQHDDSRHAPAEARGAEPGSERWRPAAAAAARRPQDASLESRAERDALTGQPGRPFKGRRSGGPERLALHLRARRS